MNQNHDKKREKSVVNKMSAYIEKKEKEVNMRCQILKSQIV